MAAKRVLVVEDDLLNRMLLCDVLETRGFVVESVSDGAHAIDAARRFAPSLIIMDINLPNVSGLELITRMQVDPTLREVPILAVTAYVGKEEERRIREAGATEYISKPMSIEPFMAAVTRLLSA